MNQQVGLVGPQRYCRASADSTAASLLNSRTPRTLLQEWKLIDRRTRVYSWLGIVVLIVSVIMIGVGDGFVRRD